MNTFILFLSLFRSQISIIMLSVRIIPPIWIQWRWCLCAFTCETYVFIFPHCTHFNHIHALIDGMVKKNKYNKWLDRCSLLVNKQFHIFRRMEEKTEWNEEQKDKTKKWFQVNPYEKLEWQREDFEFSTQWAKKRFSNKKKKNIFINIIIVIIVFSVFNGWKCFVHSIRKRQIGCVCVCVWTSVQYAFNFCFVQMGNAFFPNWISCEWIDRSAKILRK